MDGSNDNRLQQQEQHCRYCGQRLPASQVRNIAESKSPNAMLCKTYTLEAIYRVKRMNRGFV